VRISGAGRTDTGVHARGQVVATKLLWRHSVQDLQRAWNANLPAAIAVRGLQVAPVDFHPRFSALDRTYRYTILLAADRAQWAPKRSPLTDRFALFVKQQLDLVAMQQATQLLLGAHDFATFGQAPNGENTVRVVHEATWRLIEREPTLVSPYPGQQLIFTIRANAFLYQMVRNLVGALLQVGEGRWSPADMAHALQACKREYAAPPAPPHGLVLERIRYPAELGLHFDRENGEVEF
jgi:tRNA pseudouridine38-40 synthase